MGPDFEVHRETAESVSVFFNLYRDDLTPAPSGWMVTAAKYEVEWPNDPSVIRSHFGARSQGVQLGTGTGEG